MSRYFNNEVHVVRHQAVGPHRHACPRRLLRQQVAIHFLIARFEEDRLAAVAALSHVVGKTGDDDASLAGHDVVANVRNKDRTRT